MVIRGLYHGYNGGTSGLSVVRRGFEVGGSKGLGFRAGSLSIFDLQFHVFR